MNFQELAAKLKAIEENATAGATGSGNVASAAIGASTPEIDDGMEEAITSAPPVAPTKDDGPDTAECGMMPMPPMMPHPEKQQDNVTMNVSMNGSGEGGIRSLMDILRNIEKGADTAHPHDVSALFGEPSSDHEHEEPIMGGKVDIMSLEQDMEENIEDGKTWGNSTHGDSGAHTMGIKSVTPKGNDLSSTGGTEFPKVNGGGNPMSESLVGRLQAMYQQIKEADDNKTMSRAAKGVMKYGKDGMQALAKAGKEGKNLDKVRDKYNKYD
jgi:hypothetical protein